MSVSTVRSPSSWSASDASVAMPWPFLRGRGRDCRPRNHAPFPGLDYLITVCSQNAAPVEPSQLTCHKLKLGHRAKEALESHSPRR